jgi:hypothetical protein
MTRCVYCHGENGTHFSNCWSPEGQAAWEKEVYSRTEAWRSSVEALHERIFYLESALENISHLDPLTQGDVATRIARAALDKKP